MAKVAGINVIINKANAIGAAQMVFVVDMVIIPAMDVMAHLGEMDNTFVCLDHVNMMKSVSTNLFAPFFDLVCGKSAQCLMWVRKSCISHYPAITLYFQKRWSHLGELRRKFANFCKCKNICI